MVRFGSMKLRLEADRLARKCTRNMDKLGFPMSHRIALNKPHAAPWSKVARLMRLTSGNDEFSHGDSLPFDSHHSLDLRVHAKSANTGALRVHNLSFPGTASEVLTGPRGRSSSQQCMARAESGRQSRWLWGRLPRWCLSVGRRWCRPGVCRPLAPSDSQLTATRDRESRQCWGNSRGRTRRLSIPRPLPTPC